MGIFSRKRASLTSTGHAGDDQVLAELAMRTDLGIPRQWVHYLTFGDEDAARGAAAQLLGHGWTLRTVDEAAAGGPAWVVVVEQSDVVTDHRRVQEARVFLEGIAAAHPGGEYDGWEASV